MALKRKHEERLQYFNHFYDSGKNRNDELRPRWDEWQNAFEGNPNKPEAEGSIDDWRSKVRIQYGKQQILTLASQLAIDDLPSFSYEPRHHSQSEYANVASGLGAYWFDRDNYVTKRLLSAVVAGITGSCPIKIHWLYRTQKMNVRDEYGMVREVEAVVEDRPVADILDPRNFFYDPKAPQQESWRFAGHKAVVPLSELKSAKRSDGSPMYQNLKEIEDMLRADAEEQSPEPGKSAEKSKLDRNGIEVVEMWTRTRVMVRAAGKVIIRDEPNPFFHGQIPFVLIQTQQNPFGDSWGLSEMEPIVAPQEMLWSIGQSAQNALKLSIDPPLAVDVTVDPENAEKPIEPGARFAGKGNAREFVQPMNVTGVDFFTSANAQDHLQGQMEFSTGITREIAGQSNASSATEAAINERQSKSRMTSKLRTVDWGWARVAEQFLMLAQQFLDTTQPVRIMGQDGEQWVEIDPMQIAGLWSVRPRNTSERALKEIQIENNSRMLEVLMPLMSPDFVTPSGKTINPEPVLRKFAEILDLGADDILVDADMMREQVVASQQAYAEVDAQAMAEEMAVEMVQEMLGGTDGQGAEGEPPDGGDAGTIGF